LKLLAELDKVKKLSGLSTMPDKAQPCASVHEDDESSNLPDYTHEEMAQEMDDFFSNVAASPELNE
jgi:hypothetical protein